MLLTDLVNLFINAFTGFIFWLIVTPLRLVVVLLDPIFGSLTDVFDFSGFLQVMEPLRGFFTDVNYFLPFAAAVGMIRATIDVMLLYTIGRGFSAMTVGHFATIVLNLLTGLVQDAKDRVKKLVTGVLEFFFPNFFGGIINIGG